MSAARDTWSAYRIPTSNGDSAYLIPYDSVWASRRAVWVARETLADARAALAAAVKFQHPDRHFRGLPESPEVTAAYDAVRDAEGAMARLEREGRR